MRRCPEDSGLREKTTASQKITLSEPPRFPANLCVATPTNNSSKQKKRDKPASSFLFRFELKTYTNHHR